MRERHPEMKAITTARMTIILNPGQCFYTTPKAFEVWQEEPLQRLKRIPALRVFWVARDDGMIFATEE